MKTVKQIVAVVVWCTISVGCVAEEAKKPTVSAGVVSPAKDVRPDENITIHVDPVTQAEYQELKASYIVEKFNYDPSSSRRHFILLNNLWISKQGWKISGQFILPQGVMHGEWNKLIGKKVHIYCRLREPPKKYNLCRGGCSDLGSKDFIFEKYCDLEPSSGYFLKFD